jgi:hypothetical protein
MCGVICLFIHTTNYLQCQGLGWALILEMKEAELPVLWDPEADSTCKQQKHLR